MKDNRICALKMDELVRPFLINHIEQAYLVNVDLIDEAGDILVVFPNYSKIDQNWNIRSVCIISGDRFVNRIVNDYEFMRHVLYCEGNTDLFFDYMGQFKLPTYEDSDLAIINKLMCGAF